MNISEYGPAATTQAIGVHPSTVSRELRRFGVEVP
jgi:IS30 family transposase